MIRVNLLRSVSREAREKKRWERSADRANERLRTKQPLLVAAGIVPLVTPDDRKAKLGDARRRARIDSAARERAQAAKGVELREEVRQRLGPEKFAEIEGRRHGLTSEAQFWGGILDGIRNRENGKLDGAASLRDMPDPTPLLPAPQVALFGELPSGETVPLVVAGHTRALEDIAAEHGIDLAAPQRPDPPPCPDCGWTWKPYDALVYNLHNPNCPSWRAFLLGMDEGCADCKATAKRYSRPPGGPCEAHRARTLACAREGCIPGPPKHHYMGEACQRCGISIGAAPYARPKAA